MRETGEIMRFRLSNKGFTLVEVVAVLIVLGILMATLISRGMDTEPSRLRSEVDTLKAHLRYAQYLALNDIEPVRWGIAINGSSYTLVRNLSGDGTTFDYPHSLPNESPLPGKPAYTHTINPFAATSTNILFDEWGSPGNATIDITLGGEPIRITAETGYIP